MAGCRGHRQQGPAQHARQVAPLGGPLLHALLQLGDRHASVGERCASAWCAVIPSIRRTSKVPPAALLPAPSRPVEAAKRAASRFKRALTPPAQAGVTWPTRSTCSTSSS
eukprot:3206579-Prymnesium_polylepis.1